GHGPYAVERSAGAYGALGGELKLQGGEAPTAMELRPAGLVLIAPQNLVVVSREGQVKQQVYYPAPQLPGLLRALYRINAVRAGLYGAAASAYGDAFAQASRNATDSTGRRITGQMATAYTQGGAQLAGYSHQAAALATKRFKASLSVPEAVFMLTRAPEGNGNVLLQLDKDSGAPRSRVDLGKEREPVYAVDDVANMLFLQTASGTLLAVVAESGFASKLPHDTMTIAEILVWAGAEHARKQVAEAAAKAAERARQDSVRKLLEPLLAVTVVKKTYLPRNPDAEQYE